MRWSWVRWMPVCSLLAGASWLGMATLPANAQSSAPSLPSAPEPASVDLSAGSPPNLLAGGGEPVAFAPNMLGDFASVSVFNSAANIAENESPRPLDRLFFSFNFYDNLDRSTLNAIGSPVHNVQTFRYTFGAEKTFLDGDFSIGLRAPINTVDADGRVLSGPFGSVSGQGITGTEFGDLSIILKGVLAQCRATGSLVSAGLAITAATGPRHFPQAPAVSLLVNGERSTALQPFLGAIWTSGHFFLQGFSSIEIPTTRDDPLIWFNDVGVGYYVYRNWERDRLLTAIVPTLEMHLNDPLRDRGSVNIGGPDILDLTVGATIEFRRSAALAIGLVAPMTGPKPFDFEVLTHVNFRF
ncbi:MAG TPA: hypothetical protein VKU02_02555 [Gemmataceae bacterium]|nr:hypothetical protein [Gemmataceae bacterium]